MIKKTILIFTVLMMVLTVNGQTNSSLHQVLASKSLIDRPLVFRNMQSGMIDEFGNVSPGLNLEFLYEKMSGVREDLLGLIKTPTLKYDTSKNTLSITYPKLKPITISISIDLEEKPFLLLDSLLADILTKQIATLLKKLSEKQRKGILSAVIKALEKFGYNLSDITETVSLEKRLGHILAFGLTKGLKKRISDKWPDEKLDSHTIKTLVMDVQDEFNKVSANLRERLSAVLDVAEHEIANVVDEFSWILLSANAGLSITEGPEGFNGGFLVSFVLSEHWQVGTYINGEFSQHDDTTNTIPKQSLLGFQLQCAFLDAWQLDLLGSLLFGGKGFKMAEVFEVGSGISWRVCPDYIAGLEGYWTSTSRTTTDQKFEDIWSFGISLKGTSSNSPSILLGWTFQDGSDKPFVQVGFPILASN